MSVTQTAERTLPSNKEAEKSVLGSVLVHNDAWTKAAAVLTGADFFSDAHRRIFEAMERLIVSGSPIDFTLLREELGRSGDIDEVGGPAYISSLADGVPRATNVEHYANVVKEKARLRAAIYAANKTLTAAYEAEQSSAVVVEDGVRAMLEIGLEQRRGSVTIGQALDDYTASLDADRGLGIPTGYRDVDDITGGVERGKLTIVAARPSVGKTSFAVGLADYATKQAIPVGVLSLEEEPRALAAHLLAHHSGVSSDRMRRKIMGEKSWSKVGHALHELRDRPLHIVQDAGTLTQVQAWSRRLRDEHGVQMIVLDYIQLMGQQGTRDRQQEIAYISRGLKRTAQELDVAMVALSQLSRAPEARTDKRPQLSDMRESGALEQDADLVLMLFREEMYKQTEANAGIAEVIVAKNRSGPTGTVKLVFIADVARFADLAVGML